MLKKVLVVRLFFGHSTQVSVYWWKYFLSPRGPIGVLLPPNNFKLITRHWVPAAGVRPHVLHWGVNLHPFQFLPSQGRAMSMFFKTLFPVSLSRADVAEVALSARVFVNDTRHKRTGNFVFERETWWQTMRSFENNLEFWERKQFPEAADQGILRFPRVGAQKWQHH